MNVGQLGSGDHHGSGDHCARSRADRVHGPGAVRGSARGDERQPSSAPVDCGREEAADAAAREAFPQPQPEAKQIAEAVHMGPVEGGGTSGQPGNRSQLLPDAAPSGMPTTGQVRRGLNLP